jgi:hypothetical protein
MLYLVPILDLIDEDVDAKPESVMRFFSSPRIISGYVFDLLDHNKSASKFNLKF